MTMAYMNKYQSDDYRREELIILFAFDNRMTALSNPSIYAKISHFIKFHLKQIAKVLIFVLLFVSLHPSLQYFMI
jgi:hypothetical protein